MGLVDIIDLSFCYPGSYEPVFTNVSLQLSTDWKLGFIGRNGKGKTTFLKLLAGELKGTGQIRTEADFVYFPYGVADPDQNTGPLLRALCPETPFWMLERELNKLNLAADIWERPFSTLSNGEQTKALLGALFLHEKGFLLIDEPTNHLDGEARSLVSRYLNGKSGFILVSHDRAFLDGCTDHTLSVNRSSITLQQGNFSCWYENKTRQDLFEQGENEKLQREIGRLKEAATRSGGWADRAERSKIGYSPGREETRAYIGKKSEKLQKQRKNMERRRQAAAEEKSGLLKDVEKQEQLKLHPLLYRSSRLMELRDVSLFYGERPVQRQLSFTVERGKALALRGANGCGKSTVLKLLEGAAAEYTGSFSRGSGLKLSVVPQDPGRLSGSLQDYERSCGIDGTLFRTILRKLDFSREQFDRDLSQYSAGQKKKVLLARSLSEEAHLYIWDEPLNYIDVFSRMQIEALLLAYRPTLVFVEHDRAFCENTADRIIDLTVTAAP